MVLVNNERFANYDTSDEVIVAIAKYLKIDLNDVHDGNEYVEGALNRYVEKSDWRENLEDCDENEIEEIEEKIAAAIKFNNEWSNAEFFEEIAKIAKGYVDDGTEYLYWGGEKIKVK